MTEPVMTFVRCSCGEFIALFEATCPHCGTPHTRVLSPASAPSRSAHETPLSSRLSTGGVDGALRSSEAVPYSGGHQERRTHVALGVPSRQRDEGAAATAPHVEISRDLTTAERGYVMPVGIDRDADISEDLRGFDPDCRIFLEDERHRCTRNTGQLVRFGETCFYGAQSTVRRAS